MGSETPTADEGARRAGGHDELLTAAQELAGADEVGARPRMRRGQVRRRGRRISEDGAEALREPSGVRSTADEGDAPDEPDVPPAPPEREMLDASGSVLSPEVVVAPGPSTARVIDAGAVIAEAVRSYLEALDNRGADDPVTRDRHERLRATLEQYDGAT